MINYIRAHFQQILLCSLSTALTIALFGLKASGIQVAHAAPNTWTVNDLGDSGTTTCVGGGGSNGPTCQLRDAISKAQSGDPIYFSVNGTIDTTSPLTVAVNMSISGSGGYSVTIDGNKFLGSIFVINSGIHVSFDHLTFQNGGSSNTNGGAFYNGGQLIISYCTFLHNSGNDGGVIDDVGTKLDISRSTFTNNNAYYGGVIYNLPDISLTISESTFSGNGAIFNGGVILSHANMGDTSSGYYNNHSGNDGGVINSSSGTTWISGDTFSGNQAGTASGNGYGGAIVAAGNLNISNTTIVNNKAGVSTGYGGGIYSSAGTTTVANSTVSGNSAVYGGGIAFYANGGAFFWLGSSIVAQNTATTDPDITAPVGPVGSLGYNVVGNLTSGLTSSTGDQIGSAANPIDPLLYPIDAYGEATLQTMALKVGSPAISKGNCNLPSPASAVSSDERNITRKSPCDVGAYEMTPSDIDTIGIFRNGTFYLRLHNSTGFADLTVAFNPAAKPYPVVGDWTGSNYDAVGIFNQNSGLFSLCKVNTTAGCASAGNVIQLILGIPNDIPLSGRWLYGATTDGVGVFRPSNGLIYLKNNLTTGYADDTMVLGIPGDVGLAGSWYNPGYDSPGVYRPSNSTFYLSNQVCNCAVYADYQLTYGVSGDSPVVGDWIGQSSFGVGLFRPTNGYTYLKNILSTGYADTGFTYGIAGDVPVAGHWQTVYPPQPSAEAVNKPPAILIQPTAAPANAVANPNAGLGD